jgi:hypothetical protein
MDTILGIIIGIVLAVQGVILLRHASRMWFYIYGATVVLGVLLIDLTTDYSTVTTGALLVAFGLATIVGRSVYDPQPQPVTK